MSLINNMLKDLEKRKARPELVPILSSRETTQSFIRNPFNIFNRFSSKHTSTITALSLLGFLLAFIVIKHFWNASPSVSSTFIKEPVISTPLANQTQDSPWLTPVSITGITLQVKDNVTELSFLLNHEALYRINSESMSNQLSLTIEQSQLQSELPLTAYLNTAIQHITSERNGNDTTFKLTLFPGAFVKYVNINTENKNSEIVLAIEYGSMENKIKGHLSNSTNIKAPVMQSLLIQEYKNALAKAEVGDYHSAIDQLSALLKADPGYKDARTSLTALMIDQGQLLKAEKIIDTGLKIAPQYSPFVELKARLMAQEGKIKSAITLLQSAQPAMEENPEYHAFIAALYAQNNNDSLAVKLYRQLLEINPHNGSWWFGLGVSLDRLDYSQEAMNAYSKAISEGKLNADAVSYLQNRLKVLQENMNAKG